MLGRLLGPLERAVFAPDLLPPALVTALAFAPPLAAGLLLFRIPAAEMLGLAVGLGGLVHVAARRAGWPVLQSPALAAIVGVAILGPGAPIGFAAAVALAAAGLEALRGRYLPGARGEAGLLAYGLLLLGLRGVPDWYFNPGSAHPLPEPIRIWLTYGGAPLDPVRLYVGNVPGPVFATSLLAVVIGAAWLWYARRLSLAVLAGFFAGSLAVCAVMGWSPSYQLMSGPAWLVVALVLADRRTLPRLRVARPVLGLAVGIAALALRARGAGIEATMLAVVAAQLTVALVEGAGWLVANRRRLWSGRPRLGGFQLQLSNPLRRVRRSTTG